MNGNSGNQYRYHGLSHGYIRLLRLLPGASPFITCELESVELNSQCPRFTALSYTWDGQVQYRPILISGQVVFITPNAESFLRRAQWCGSPRNLISRGDEGREFLRMTDYFWIDSVCINQDDNAERDNQVALMKQIYETAYSIAIWLGEPQRYTTQAFEYIKQRHNAPQNWEQSQIDFGPGKQGLVELLQRSYWRRSWVLQEITTPKRMEHKMVLCGDLHAPLELFLALVPTPDEAAPESNTNARPDQHVSDFEKTGMPHRRAFLRALGRAVHLDLESPLLEDLINQYLGTPEPNLRERRIWREKFERYGIQPSYRQIAEGIRRRTNFDIMALDHDLYDVNTTSESSSLVPQRTAPSNYHALEEMCNKLLAPIKKTTLERIQSDKVDLFHLFQYVEAQQATDARDKLFAPLQLAREAAHYRSTYKKPAWVVYCEFASFLLRTTASLQLLAYAFQSEVQLHVLPSWVPDWTRKEIYNAVPLPKRETQWSRLPLFNIDTERSKALEGDISHNSRSLTPDEFQRLSPTERPRLRGYAVRIGTIEEPENRSRTFSPFQDLEPYWRGRRVVNLKPSPAASTEALQTRFGILELDKCLVVLAPDVAVDGDEVFFVFGARYPLILRKVRHPRIQRLANRATGHPDGLDEYTYRGEAVCRYLDPWPHHNPNSAAGRHWHLLEESLTRVPWGMLEQDYRNLFLESGPNIFQDIVEEMHEIAIV